MGFVTSSSSFAQLLVLNEASKHLRLHEELQEVPDSPGRVGLAEGVALQLLGSVGRLHHVEGVVADQLHEESHKALRQQRAQVRLLTWTEG